jgi:hypothetical protein
MKRRVWSFIFFLGLLLTEAWFLWSTILDFEAPWKIKKQIMILAAGTILLLFVLFLKLFKSTKASINPEKFEAFSRYIIQMPLWFLLSLLLVELTLRITTYSPPLKVAVTNWAGDVPGVQTFILWGKEGYGLTWYDKWGALQTPYHDNKKDNNVIVLGDSQTE